VSMISISVGSITVNAMIHLFIFQRAALLPEVEEFGV
jgi:hypothetical protein